MLPLNEINAIERFVERWRPEPNPAQAAKRKALIGEFFDIATGTGFEIGILTAVVSNDTELFALLSAGEGKLTDLQRSLLTKFETALAKNRADWNLTYKNCDPVRWPPANKTPALELLADWRLAWDMLGLTR